MDKKYNIINIIKLIDYRINVYRHTGVL